MKPALLVRYVPVALVWLSLAGTFACGNHRNAVRPETTAPAANVSVERLFPLPDGATFVYDHVRSGHGLREQMLVRVQRISPADALFRTARGVKHLLVTDSSIRREGSPGFLLQAPMEKGAHWVGDNGGDTEVVATDHTARVPAGVFHHCVRTIERLQNGRERGTVESVYCPSVGLVGMRIQQWIGAERLNDERMVLRSFFLGKQAQDDR